MDTTKTEGIVKPRRSIAKWIISVIIALLILVVIVIALVPFYVSSTSGRNMIVEKINSSVPGHLKISDLSMGWFSGVKLSDVSYEDNKGGMSVAVKSVYTQPQYGSIIMGNIALGKTVIDEPVVKIDVAKMQEQPQTKPTAKEEAKTEPKAQPQQAAKSESHELPVKRLDLTINNGNVTVSDSAGGMKPVTISKINTRLDLRPTGQPTTFNINLVAAEASNAPIELKGNITPSAEHGWQLVGTSGDVRIDINSLDLGSLGAVFAMVDPNMVAKGTISINGVAKLNNGVFEQLNVTLNGDNLNFRMPQLKGDSFVTKKLTGNVSVASSADMITIQKFDFATDYSNVTMSGTLPKNFKSVQDLLDPKSQAMLKGNVNVDVARLTSQLPHTMGLKPGTKLDSGSVKADINTETTEGQKYIVAKAEISNVQGVVNNKPAKLSPITLDAKVAGQGNAFKIDQLLLDSVFAKINVSGTMEAIKYSAEGDLAKMQTELGQFVDFGKYKLAGEFNGSGNVAMKDKAIASDGTMKLANLQISQKDGTSVTEPAITMDYNVGVDQKQNVLNIGKFGLASSFASVQIADATVPTDPNSKAPMKLAVTADVDLAKSAPWAIMFAGFNKTTKIDGKLNAKVDVTGQNNDYHIVTENTKITNLSITVPNQPTFQQQQISLIADAYVNPVAKTYKIKELKLESQAINLELQKFSQTNEKGQVKLDGALKATYDLAGVTAMAAPFMPAGLTMTGKRDDLITFSSQWPENDPNKMLANMNANAAFGFASAEYMGLAVGQTDVKVNFKNGLMNIEPFKTTCNSGTIQFAGSADFKKKPTMLVITKEMDVVNNVQINDKVAAALLKNVNPIFASASNTRGSANLHCKTLAIPIAGGTDNDTKLDATVSVLDLNLQSPLLSVLSMLVGKINSKVNPNAPMALHPTNFVMQNGILTYSNMQVDVSGMTLAFSGQMGPGDNMNMSVTLPGLGGVALKGTKSHPGIDEGKTLQLILQQQLKQGLLGEGQKGQPQPQQQQPGQPQPQQPKSKKKQQQQQVEQDIQNLLKGLGNK